MTKPLQTKAPGHLTVATQTWWLGVKAEFPGWPEHNLRMLTLAGESWDLSEKARKVIKTLGMVYQDRFNQPHARPEVKIAHDAKLLFSRLCRELCMDLEDADEPRIPRRNGE